MKKRADGFVLYQRPRKYYDSLFVNLANFFACLPLPHYNGLKCFSLLYNLFSFIVLWFRNENFLVHTKILNHYRKIRYILVINIQLDK